MTENTFKSRYTGHKSSFNNKKLRHSTTLSDYVWKLKEEKVEYEIKWKILAGPIPAYDVTTKSCPLCTEEKRMILLASKCNSLNSRNEIKSTCRHKKKYLLANQ